MLLTPHYALFALDCAGTVFSRRAKRLVIDWSLGDVVDQQQGGVCVRGGGCGRGGVRLEVACGRLSGAFTTEESYVIIIMLCTRPKQVM